MRGEERRAILGRLDRRFLKEFRKNKGTYKQPNASSAQKSKQKRLSSEEFLKVHDEIWKPGPSVNYQNPDNWYKRLNSP